MKKAVLISVALATIAVGVLLFLESLWGVWTVGWLLIPGKLVGMVLITGGHGGSFEEERIALLLGSLVNVATYALLIWSAMQFMHDEGLRGRRQ
jgi:hypothetical protein